MHQKLFWSIFLLCVAVPSMAVEKRICEKLPASYSISAAVTIEEIETEELKALAEITKGRPDVPQVPFGFMNTEWKFFKAGIEDGDIIVRFTSDPQSWGALAGRQGLAVLRKGCIKDRFITRMN